MISKNYLSCRDRFFLNVVYTQKKWSFYDDGRDQMHTDIKQCFEHLTKEREKLTQRLNDKKDVGTQRLKNWLLFNTNCVIAENYDSDVRKKLKLNIAINFLNEAKDEMKQYGIGHDEFKPIEQAMKKVIDTINKLVSVQYKSTVSGMKAPSNHAMADKRAPYTGPCASG